MLEWNQATKFGWNVEFKAFIQPSHLKKKKRTLLKAGSMIYLSSVLPLEEKHLSFSKKV